MNYLARLRGKSTPQGGGRETPAAPQKNPVTPSRGTDKTDKTRFCQFKGVLSVPDFGKKPQPAPAPIPPTKPAAQPCESWAERAAILEHDAGLSRADAEEQATCRRWLIRLAAGWLDITTTPPACLAELRTRYPEALAILPADDDADLWAEDDHEGGEPGHPQEEDPAAAFYSALFAGMDAPRAYVTLGQAEIHAAVVAGMIRPEEARGAVLLATRDQSGHCALLAVPQERWDPVAFLALVDGPGTLH